MKRRCAVVLLAVLLFVVWGSAQGYAAQARASEEIMSYYATISKNNQGQLSIYFSIKCRTNMNVLGTTSIVVQRFNGTSWVSEYTFNIRDYPKMQTNNKSSYWATMLYSPHYSGTQYRAMVFFYARNSAGSDTAVKTTSSVAT